MSGDDAYEAKQARTAEAFDDPQPGDRFHEMYSWWTYVLARIDDVVIWLTASPPCTFPDDGRLHCGTVEEFQRAYGYVSMPGYSVLLADRGNNVDGWLEQAVEAYR